MLLRTLFVLVLLGGLAETIVHGIHALSQAALKRQALAAVHAQIVSSATLARETVARAIAAGGDPRRLEPIPPSPAPACRLRVGRGCAIEASATIVFGAGTVGLPGSPAPCPSAGCTIYEQENDAVDEGRIDALIAARATASDGALLAQRAARVTLRTMRVAPYAAFAGEADESLAAVAGAAGSGDDGGAAPNDAAPGSLIDVLYENAVTGSTIPANVWHAQVESREATPGPWSP